MIDNKKIEDAKDNIFNKYFLKNNEGMICVDHISEPIYLDYQIKQAIELGAKWMQEEFLKDLWHPANKIPEIGRVIIMKNYYPDSRIEFLSNWRKSTSNNPIEGNTQKWLYVDNLLPNRKGAVSND